MRIPRNTMGNHAMRRARHSQAGSALVVVLAILALMMALLSANSHTLALLRQEIRKVEQRQLQRYGTNLVTAPLPPKAAAETGDEVP